jgi:glyoxylase-like metal-dependent hydrolase (beta-lactamase superfamily II)
MHDATFWPALAPFTIDPAKALVSLDALDGLSAGWVLPGHGDAWTGVSRRRSG